MRQLAHSSLPQAPHNSTHFTPAARGLAQRCCARPPARHVARSATLHETTSDRTGSNSGQDTRSRDMLHGQPTPSTSSSSYTSNSAWDLASFGTRVVLERIYNDGRSPLMLSPDAFLVTVEDRPSQKTRNQDKTSDYFANLGDAIRSLREDTPLLFQKELNYEIYRDDIVFRDPRNSFSGLKNYKLIFWSLRFHGKIFFKTLYVDVKRIWQTEDNVIKMRWTVHGVPRVPWEAEGLFDGISTYRLDGKGKIYEHSVDNILLRDPPMATNPPLLAGLNLVPTQQPVPGIFCGGVDLEPTLVLYMLTHFSWVRFYSAMLTTMQLAARQPALVAALA